MLARRSTRMPLPEPPGTYSDSKLSVFALRALWPKRSGGTRGIISPTLFTMLVLMALVTTFATTPLLRLVPGPRGFGAADEFNAV